MRPLEASARAKGVQFLLNYHMDSIIREPPTSGRILGIRAYYLMYDVTILKKLR